MKNKSIDCLHDMVGTLCRQIDDPTGLTHLYEVMVAVIELARTDRAWRAVNVANEVVHHLALMAEERGQELGSRMLAEDRESSAVGIGTVAPAWTMPVGGVERMRIHSDGYVQIRPEAPKPVATVEQMRAAADAAMASDDDLTEWTCDVCRKKTLTESLITPIGWSRTINSNTGKLEYTCNECQKFGHKQDDHIGWFVCNGCGQRTATSDGKKPLAWVFNADIDGKVYKALCPPCFGTGIKKQYQCMGCDSETESRVFPPPGWKEVEDGEVICFACAEEEAKP